MVRAALDKQPADVRRMFDAVARRYDVMSVPTVLILDAAGIETGRLVGAASAAAFADAVADATGVSAAA